MTSERADQTVEKCRPSQQSCLPCRSSIEAKSNCLCIIWTSSCGTTYALHCNPFPGRLLLSHTLDGCTKSEPADYIVVLCSTVHRLPINHHVSGYNPPAWTRTRLCCSATDGIRFAFYSSSCRGREGGQGIVLLLLMVETHEKNVESFQVAGHHRER